MFGEKVNLHLILAKRKSTEKVLLPEPLVSQTLFQEGTDIFLV